MSDTKNSGADPWGLPENPPTPEEESQVAEAQPEQVVAEPAESAEATPPPPVDIEIEPIDDAPGAEASPESETPPPPPQPESRGPLSQVLAASGLFGGTPIPRASEPAAEETPDAAPDDDATNIDVGALETPEPSAETTPPDLAAPTSGAPVGIGATDADLPNEPPPWMVTEPVLPESPVAPEPAISDEVAALDTGASLEEAAAAFAGIGVDPAEGDDATTGLLDSLDDVEEVTAADADMESLVAELADIEPVEEVLVDEITDISFDPASTPTVYRELESLDPADDIVEIPELDDAIVEYEGIGAATNEVPELLADAPDEASHIVADAADALVSVSESDDIASADPELDASTIEDPEIDSPDRPEWGLFEYGDEPSEPDAPVFGVTFGSPSPDEPEDAGLESEDAAQESEDAAQESEDAAQESEDDVQLLDEPQFLEDHEPEVAVEEPELVADLGYLAEEAPISTELDVEDVVPSPETMVESLEADDSEVTENAIVPVTVGDTEPSTEIPEVDLPPTAEPDLAAVDTDETVDEELVASEPDPESAAGDTAPIEWGSRWQESAQGWVEDDQGRSTWRPIITTSPLLSEWQIDTYLGVVAADMILGSGPIQTEMAAGRTAAMRALVDEAMARGAHAIVGVTTTMAPIGANTVLTATGTAVTLKAQD